MDSSSQNGVYKVILLGDSGVGKSSLKNCYIGNKFDANYHTTLGADFSVKDIMMNETEIKLFIWDLAGQDVFSLIRDRYYKSADGIIIVFDLLNQQSLENTLQWLNEYMENPTTEFVPILLLGNKNDLIQESEDYISKEDLDNYVNQIISWGKKKHENFENNFQYYNTSARTGDQVDFAFSSLINKIIERRPVVNN